MKTRALGSSNLNVSEICLGTMTWGEQNTQEDAFEQMDYALEQGVTFWDTAELYAVPPKKETQGKTEQIIGNWFAARGKREQIILASKISGNGFDWIRAGQAMQAKHVETALNGSLKRLQTEYIDLYQLHWPSRAHYHFANNWAYNPSGQDKAQIEDHMLAMLEALQTQVKAGKIRHIGLSNESCWGTMRYQALSQTAGLPPIVSVQNEYSLLKRLYDLDMAELSAMENIGLLAYSPLAGGLLSGKYVGGIVPKGSRAELIPAIHGRKCKYSEEPIQAYLNVAKEHGLDPCQMALAFVLSRPFTTSVIIGATTMTQLKTNIGASNLTLSPEVLDDIANVYRQYPMPF